MLTHGRKNSRVMVDVVVDLPDELLIFLLKIFYEWKTILLKILSQKQHEMIYVGFMLFNDKSILKSLLKNGYRNIMQYFAKRWEARLEAFSNMNRLINISQHRRVSQKFSSVIKKNHWRKFCEIYFDKRLKETTYKNRRAEFQSDERNAFKRG